MVLLQRQSMVWIARTQICHVGSMSTISLAWQPENTHKESAISSVEIGWFSVGVIVWAHCSLSKMKIYQVSYHLNTFKLVTSCTRTLGSIFRLVNFNWAFTSQIKYHVFREVPPVNVCSHGTQLSFLHISTQLNSLVQCVSFPPEYKINGNTS